MGRARLGDHYWDKRRKYEQVTGKRLTSLADAPRIAKQWHAADQCIPLRSRDAPLMVEGHFMDTPEEESFNASDFKHRHEDEMGPRHSAGAVEPRAAAAAASLQRDAAVAALGVVIALVVLVF